MRFGRTPGSNDTFRWGRDCYTAQIGPFQRGYRDRTPAARVRSRGPAPVIDTVSKWAKREPSWLTILQVGSTAGTSVSARADSVASPNDLMARFRTL